MDKNPTNPSQPSINPSPSSSETQVRVLILGTGPAGLTAALYTARADLEPVVLAGMEHGGQVSLTNRIENYPGFPEGIGGYELVDRFQKQAERFGARIEFDTATEVDFSRRPFRVKTYNSAYLADTVIISTGAASRKLNIPGEREMIGRGVSYCATCDGWFFKGKEVAVIGGGDSALEEGLLLTRFTKSVTIVHRRDTLRAGAVLQDRAKENDKIKFIWNSKGNHLLFNLKDDPGENTNLIVRQPQQAAMMVKRLGSYLASLPKPGAAGPVQEIDQQTRDALKSLGYVK